jgi:hypothetical protein
MTVVPTVVSSASPSTILGIAVDCGPLAPDDCRNAVAVAEVTIPLSRQPVVSVRIASPSALETCPPSGGPAYVPPSGGPVSAPHFCEVIVTVTTPTGHMAVGLLRNGNGWIRAGAVL